MAEQKHREATHTRLHGWHSVNQDLSDVRTHALFSFYLSGEALTLGI